MRLEFARPPSREMPGLLPPIALPQHCIMNETNTLTQLEQR